MTEHFDTITLSNDHPIYCEFTELSEEYLTVDGSTFCRTVEQHPRLMRVLEILGTELYSIEFFASDTKHFEGGRYLSDLGRVRSDPAYQKPTVHDQFPAVNTLPQHRGQIQLKIPSRWTPAIPMGPSALNACDVAGSKVEATMISLAHHLGHHLIGEQTRTLPHEPLLLELLKMPKTRFVSAYAEKRAPQESYNRGLHFCESLAVFTVLPEALQRFDPDTYEFMENFLNLLEASLSQ